MMMLYYSTCLLTQLYSFDCPRIYLHVLITLLIVNGIVRLLNAYIVNILKWNGDSELLVALHLIYCCTDSL